MKIVSGFVAALALGLVIGGCSSSDEGADGLGPDPDLGAVQGRFDRPDGTFNGSNAKGVIERGTNGGSGLDFTGPMGGGSGTSTKSTGGLRPADASDDSPFRCDALMSGQQTGTCACPNGGAMRYAISGNRQSGSGGDALIKIRLDQCAMSDSVIDGHEYMHMHTDMSNQQNPTMSMIFFIDATVTSRGETQRIQFQSRFSEGDTEMAVKVDDGWVVVSIKRGASGGEGVTWTVRDRNGSWTCVVDNDHGQCTSSSGEKHSW